MKTGTPPLPPSLFRDQTQPTPAPELEPESPPPLTREQFRALTREQRRILTRLMRSRPTGLTRDALCRSLAHAMPAHTFDHTLVGLLYSGYVRVNAARRLRALPLTVGDENPRQTKSSLPRPIAVTYVTGPTAPNPAPRDLLREIAGSPYNPADPRRRNLFSLSR
jgi:hypothetical protein